MNEENNSVVESNTVEPKAIDPKESPFKFIQEHPDRFLWALCVVPILGLIIELALSIPLMYSFFIYLGLNVGFSILDEKELTKTDRIAPAHWMVLVVPIYIWQRVKLNKQDKKAFFAWVIAFIFSTFITEMINDNAIEEQACQLVTQIYQKQFYQKSSECIAVTLDEEVKSGFYKGTAVMNNGLDVYITVDIRKDDEIYVQIPNQ